MQFSTVFHRVALGILVLGIVATAVHASDEVPVLARVNGESITIDDLYRELEDYHRAVQDPQQTVQRPQLDNLLDRLINARLIVQEARNIGLDEQEEYLSLIDGYRRGALRRLVLDQQVGDVKPDPSKVKEIYQLLVTRYRIRGVLMESKEEAERLQQRAEAGEEIESLIAELVANGQAKPTDPQLLYRPDELFPEIVAELEKIEVGQFTPLVSVRHVFAFAQLLEVKMLEDPDAQAIAEEEALRVKLDEVKREFVESLVERYVKVDRAMVDSLDLDDPASDFEELKTDTRPIVSIDGAEPITVGELCSALEQQFFHGAAKASDGGKLTQRKERVLHELITARVTLREARKLRLDETEQFRSQVDNYSNGLLFTMFVQRVVEPEIEIADEDLKDYMQRHIADFTSPEMMQLDALVFTEKEPARRTLNKLNRGADWEWTRTNASGQLDTETAEVLPFDPVMPLTTDGLPPQLRKATVGASPGDYRYLAQSSTGPYYVIWVRNVIPTRTQSFQEVKGRLGKPVFAEKRQQVIDGWTRELRAASDVERVVDGAQLAKLVGMGSAD